MRSGSGPPACSSTRSHRRPRVRRAWGGDVHATYGVIAVSVMGVSRIVLGTDYPFDIGQENPVDLVEAVAGLTDEQAAQIKGGNAIERLGLR